MASQLGAIKHSEVDDFRQTGVSTKNYWPIAVAIGVILSLTGIFLTLAAHQILPSGVNAMSHLGVKVAGYCGLGIGVIIALLGAMQWHLTNQKPNMPPASQHRVVTAPPTQPASQTLSNEMPANWGCEVNTERIPAIKKLALDKVLPPANYFFWAWGAVRKDMIDPLKDFIESHKTSDLPIVIVILISSDKPTNGMRAKNCLELCQKNGHTNIYSIEFCIASDSIDLTSELNQSQMNTLLQIMQDFKPSSERSL